jgi:CelD/BcsL family acetyltransferase involved in cellulose biosynthesis
MWCELVTDFSRLEELSSDWKQWVREDSSASIFQSWEWVRAFWRAQGTAFSLCSVVVHGDRRPVGVLPLMKKGRTIEFLAACDSDYNDLLCERGLAAAVLEMALDFLLRSSLKWKSIVLEKIPAHSKVFRSIGSLSPVLQKHVQVVFRCPSPAVVVDQNKGTLDAVMGKEQLVRYQRKLQKLGSVRFRHLETREEAREHLARFFHQHVARWAMAHERSQFLQPEVRAFYEGLVEELDPRQQLRFGVLELNSQPIAYHFGFQHNGTLIWYKPAFDVNYWDFCPGDVLLRGLFQHVKEGALNELDFTIGDEPFKYRFANRVRQNYIIYVERQPDWIDSRVRSVGRRMQHVVRQRPLLKSALKRGIARVRESVDASRQFSHADVLFKSCWNGLRRLRAFIWSSEEASLWATSDSLSAKGGDVIIRSATLDDLASLSSEFDYFLTAAQLHKYRRLLKQGDKLFIARNSDSDAFVLLLGKRSEIDAFTTGPDGRLQLSEPVQAVVECWKVPQPLVRWVPAEVLRALAAHLSGTEIWIQTVGSNGSLRRAIEDAGMEFRHRLVRQTFLRSSKYTQLESPAEKNGVSIKPVVKGVIGASS